LEVDGLDAMGLENRAADRYYTTVAIEYESSAEDH
jgi:hypothetical protein